MMGCSHSQLCISTVSQPVEEPLSIKSGSYRQPSMRQFDADPAKAAEAARIKADALAIAERMLNANKGANYRDTYVRATLVSYGGSCRVFKAVNKHTNMTVAIKTITKVTSCVHCTLCSWEGYSQMLWLMAYEVH